MNIWFFRNIWLLTKLTYINHNFPYVSTIEKNIMHITGCSKREKGENSKIYCSRIDVVFFSLQYLYDVDASHGHFQITFCLFTILHLIFSISTSAQNEYWIVNTNTNTNTLLRSAQCTTAHCGTSTMLHKSLSHTILRCSLTIQMYPNLYWSHYTAVIVVYVYVAVKVYNRNK